MEKKLTKEPKHEFLVDERINLAGFLEPDKVTSFVFEIPVPKTIKRKEGKRIRFQER